MNDDRDLRTEGNSSPANTADPRHTFERREAAVSDVKTADEKDKKGELHFKKSVAREYFESAVVTLVMALFGMTFIVQAVKVPTGSMKNTIWVQDHLLVNKFIFGPHERLDVPVLRWLIPSRPIRRGDIIVFKFPKGPETNYVKRVIGLPGEMVEMKGTTVYINGQPLPERIVTVEDDKNDPPYNSAPLEIVEDEGAKEGAQWTVYYYRSREEEVGLRTYELGIGGDCHGYSVREPLRIPKKGDAIFDEIKNDPKLRPIYDLDNDGLYDSDQYFCMGDNRDNSLDGRCWGTVPRGSIVGRAMFVYWSVDYAANPTGSSNPITDIFTRTRWSRTGTFIK